MLSDNYEFQSDYFRSRIKEAVDKAVNEAEARIQADVREKVQAELREKVQAELREKVQAEVRASLITRQLTLRFGPLSENVHAHIAHMSVPELDVVGERLLSAPTLQDVFTAPS